MKHADGSGWDSQPYSRLIRDQKQSIIPSTYHTLHDVPKPRNPPVDAPELEYPVLDVDDERRVHIVPVYGGLYISLTRTKTGCEITRARTDANFWITFDGRSKVADELAKNDDSADRSNLQNRICRTFKNAECFSDPFDPKVALTLRPPIVRWLIDRTRQVTYSAPTDVSNPSHGSWGIAFDSPGDRNGEATVELPMHRFLQYPESVFRPKYNRTFPRGYLHITAPCWFDLSRFFIDEASYEGAHADNFRTDGQEWEYRLSESGLYHFARVNDESAACGASTQSNDQRGFRHSNLPLPAAICQRCTPELKKQRIAGRIESE